MIDRDIVCSDMKISAARNGSIAFLRDAMNTKDGALLNIHSRFYDHRIGTKRYLKRASDRQAYDEYH